MLNINTHFSDSVLIVGLEGRLHVDNIMVVWNGITSALNEKNTARIVVNLNDVTFVDSRGLAVLINWLKQCRQKNGDMYLCQASPMVQNVIEMTRLNLAFKMFEDEETAVQAFA
ncbi:MAG: STAS domain-containing protein [Chloroflexi bacterium]|nr:STAS domain-containing protein [Chloroflexota bacterium]